MTNAVRALQLVATAVATILDASATVAALTGHDAPQCVRVGGDLAPAIPIVEFFAGNARESGGMLGSYLVDVELYAMAGSVPDASALLAAASEALTPLAFDAAGLDAIPAPGTSAEAEPLDAADVPYPEAVGVATTLTLAVFIPPAA